jgi:hypothetical protein
VKRILICVLLVLGGTHCTLSIFYDNESWLDLARYAAGTERNPYQERIAMIPLLRLAEHSSKVRRLAQWLDQRNRRLRFYVPVTPEEIACVVCGLFSVWGMLLVCSVYGEKHIPQFWWLPAMIGLTILYVAYASRYEHALWFPYDLPHMLLFGTACFLLLEDRPWLAMLFFVLDASVRETSIFFIVLIFCLSGKRTLRQLAGMAGVCLLIWGSIRIIAIHKFGHNPTEAGSHLLRNIRTLASPADWPAVASAIGFLLIPVWMGRRYLNETARRFLWLSLPCLAVTTYFGLLIETRIFTEWTIPFALLAATEAIAAFQSQTRQYFQFGAPV